MGNGPVTTLGELVARFEPSGSIAAQTIHEGAEANHVEPFVFVEDRLVDPSQFALVEPGAFAAQLLQAMYGPRGPRS